jgi:hypothetical protein
MSRVDAIRTPVSPNQIGLEFLRQYPIARRPALRMFLAHWALETGWGSSMMNWNVGNEKSQGLSGNWCFFACSERKSRAEANRAMAESDLVQLADPEHDDGTSSPVLVKVYPEHPWSRFTAYASLSEGVASYVAMMERDFPESWRALLAGDSSRFVEVLKSEGYFTASVKAYRETYDGVLSSVDKRAAVALASASEGGAAVPLAAEPPAAPSSPSPSSASSSGLSSPYDRARGRTVSLVQKLALFFVPALTLLGFAVCSPPTPAQLRKRVVALIRGEMAAPDHDAYWAEVLDDTDPHPPQWCGALILWALRKAKLTDAFWVREKGFIYPIGLPQIQASEVQIGDIAYFSKNQHQATISEVLGGGRFRILNGNAAGGAITETETDASKVEGFFSIGRLVGDG